MEIVSKCDNYSCKATKNRKYFKESELARCEGITRHDGMKNFEYEYVRCKKVICRECIDSQNIVRDKTKKLPFCQDCAKKINEMRLEFKQCDDDMGRINLKKHVLKRDLSQLYKLELVIDHGRYMDDKYVLDDLRAKMVPIKESDVLPPPYAS